MLYNMRNLNNEKISQVNGGNCVCFRSPGCKRIFNIPPAIDMTDCMELCTLQGNNSYIWNAVCHTIENRK